MKKILIIDDDISHLAATRSLLEEEGYAVYTHGETFGTTNLVRQIKPDLVLLDINMPALSGDQLAKLLKGNAHTWKVPLVFYSSNDEDSLRQYARKFGAQGYICKGDPAILRSRVAALLNL